MVKLRSSSYYRKIEIALIVLLTPCLWLILRQAFLMRSSQNHDVQLAIISLFAVVIATETSFLLSGLVGPPFLAYIRKKQQKNRENEKSRDS